MWVEGRVLVAHHLRGVAASLVAGVRGRGQAPALVPRVLGRRETTVTRGIGRRVGQADALALDTDKDGDDGEDDEELWRFFHEDCDNCEYAYDDDDNNNDINDDDALTAHDQVQLSKVETHIVNTQHVVLWTQLNEDKIVS